MKADQTPETTHSSAQIRDILTEEMAHILHDIAPPDGQRTIARLMDELRRAYEREAGI